MMEVKQSQTAKFLKDKIVEILHSYGIEVNQVFSATTDNGANMVAAIKEMQKLAATSVAPLESLMDEEGAEELECGMIDGITSEFGSALNLIRCSVHTLQLAITDVITKNDPKIRKITDIVKDTRKTKYSIFFDHNKASKAPLWSFTRWGGRYKMIKSILKQESFYILLGQEYPEVAFPDDDWTYMKNYLSAFKPVYKLTKNLQNKHVPLSEFYIQWLQATLMVESETDNPLSIALAQALQNRLKKLLENMAFKAAVYLDPRFNFPGSTVFGAAAEKEAIQNFIINTGNRIQSLSPCTSATTAAVKSKADTVDVMDDYITKLFGGPQCSVSESEPHVTSFRKQLRQLEVEPRQPHIYDVWKHWMARKHTHPELYAVATVVHSVPSTQVSVERSFSALALVLSNIRAGLSDDTLEDILIIKLNMDILQKVLPTLHDWKTFIAESSSFS
ncbi:uncharacterized protein LOC135702131 [Ochlerotatus camptorhynchus]|uniref:uncharacterized protein LOC135702131 n=1 Tax=Ochlerotatus camptorhynchus TaxID=644619 RepID=UPI0031DC97E8